MTLTPKFWNDAAQKYAAQPIENPDAYAHKMDKTRELLTSEMQLLEIACGTGSTALAHAPYVQSVHAIDFSSEMIDIARSKAKAEGIANVEFTVQAIHELERGQHQFDMVQAHSILHLLPDTAETVRQIFELTKPGGWFVSSTTCMGDMNPLFRLALPVARWLGKAPYVSFFNGDDLIEHIRQAGFEISYEWRPDPKAAMFVIAQRPE